MTLLNIVKTQPDETTKRLIAGMSQDKECTRYNLYEEQDYDKLLELIFSHDEIISWW
jgi:hypothetical protein